MLSRGGCMNFKILSLKIEKLPECLTPLSRLFHSVRVNGKYEFLKNLYINLRNVFDISCSTCSTNYRGFIEKTLELEKLIFN